MTIIHFQGPTFCIQSIYAVSFSNGQVPITTYRTNYITKFFIFFQFGNNKRKKSHFLASWSFSWSFSGPVFSRIWIEYGPEKLETFHAVSNFQNDRVFFTQISSNSYVKVRTLKLPKMTKIRFQRTVKCKHSIYVVLICNNQIPINTCCTDLGEKYVIFIKLRNNKQAKRYFHANFGK